MQYPSLKRSFELRQHQNEVEHICRHPEANEVCLATNQGLCFLYNITVSHRLLHLLLVVAFEMKHVHSNIYYFGEIGSARHYV